jgi:hypothetical protein
MNKLRNSNKVSKYYANAASSDSEKSGRVSKAFLQMKKFDIAELKRAGEGK